MTESSLTPQQQQVIDAISSGGAIHGAIAAANVLHTDFLAWRRELLHFAAALEQAFAERELMHRERAIALVDQAYQTLGDILGNDKASPSLQFKAAKFILEQATPPIPSERKPRTTAKRAPAGAQMAENRTKMHNATDFVLNAPCICGSGKKFNECCLLEILAGAA
jgi:uncharacterized protein YecA (UPF0149 family)